MKQLLVISLFIIQSTLSVAEENDKNSNQAKPNDKPSYKNLLPSTNDSEIATIPEDQKTTTSEEVDNSRWVKPDVLDDASKKKVKSENKVQMTTSCTDAVGTVYAESDAGYVGCVQQMRTNKQGRSEPKDKKEGEKFPAVGAGVNFNIGK